MSENRDKFDEMMDRSSKEVARQMALVPDRPQGRVYMCAHAVFRLRELQAVTKAAQATHRYAKYTFWVAVCTAATAAGTLIVALFTAYGR